MVVRLNLHSVLYGVLPPEPRSSALVPTGLPDSPVMAGSSALSWARFVRVQASGQPDDPALGSIWNGPSFGAALTAAWSTELSFWGSRLIGVPLSFVDPKRKLVAAPVGRLVAAPVGFGAVVLGASVVGAEAVVVGF